MKTDLFSSLRIGNLELPNRIFMAPMTRNRAADGIPTALNATYYAQRASAGLIITEGTYPVLAARGYEFQPGIETPAQIAGWRLVTDAVHRAGGRIALQLHHAGRISHPDLTGGVAPVSASALAAKGEVRITGGAKTAYPVPRPLRTEEIPGVIELHRAATERAFAAGFDFLELHGANGYLVPQFLSNRTNHRSDAYGGSVENRARLAVEILSAMASVAGPERIGVKFNIGEFPPHDIGVDDEEKLFPYLAGELNKLRLAFIEVQQPITDWGIPATDYDAFELFRPHFAGVLIGGGTFDGETAASAIAQGRVDAVSFGRHFLANPDLPARLQKDAALNAPDMATFYTPGAKGYTDYPALNPIQPLQIQTS